MPPKSLYTIYPTYPVFFLTVCTRDRQRTLHNEVVHQASRTFSLIARDHGVSVGRYVLMLDHLHLFAGFGWDAPQLSSWIKSLKNGLSKSLRERKVPAPHWQKSFFDHLIRSNESYALKWEYVKENPVRAGLIRRWQDWPYQGEIVDLDVWSTELWALERKDGDLTITTSRTEEGNTTPPENPPRTGAWIQGWTSEPLGFDSGTDNTTSCPEEWCPRGVQAWPGRESGRRHRPVRGWSRVRAG